MATLEIRKKSLKTWLHVPSDADNFILSKFFNYRFLKEMPDFYIEIKFDCDSKYIPFFSKIAPSDIIKIWKYKKHIRIDWNIISILLKFLNQFIIIYFYLLYISLNI